MTLFVKRLRNMKDVNFVVKGIENGINAGVYTDITLMETLRLISNRDTEFYVFGVDYRRHIRSIILAKDTPIVWIGFGAIRNNNEVHKVYISEDFRGRGFGVQISLWLKQKILRNGYVPVCWIKDNNDWSKAMGKQGMEKTGNYNWHSQKYILEDFKVYLNAIEKCKIDEIVYINREDGKVK